jgi:NADH-quinone oxidoreductase subunit H
MCILTVIFFLGGWVPFIDLPFVPDFIWLVIKTMFFIYLFIFARGILFCYRYDQLMRLGWKIFLPISLGFVMLLAFWLISYNHCYSYLI